MPETEDEFELRHPPVIEAVLGIQFLPLATWSIPHFGLFWQRVRSTYPRFQVQGPILAPESVAAGTLFGARLWFIDESDQRVLQVQNDRIVINWRRRGESSYPRYRVMRSEMESLWPRFLQFLEEEDIGSPQVVRCEYTYFNHIDIPTLVSGDDPFDELFPFWRGGPATFLIEGGNQTFSNTVVMPATSSVITVTLQPAVSVELNKQVMQLSFSATTTLKSADVASVLEAADTSHALDVRAFKEFTSDKLRSKWDGEDPA